MSKQKLALLTAAAIFVSASAAMAESDPAADLAAAAIASANAESEKIASGIILPGADGAVSTTTVTTENTVIQAVPDAPMPIMPASDMKAAEAAAVPAIPQVPAPAANDVAIAPAPEASDAAAALAAEAQAEVVTETKVETKTTETKKVAAPVVEADLPPPPQEPVKIKTPAAAAANTPPVSSTVSPGEAAIMQNGQVLGQLTSPVDAAAIQPAIDPMMARPAVIRDMPKGYLTVKKTHEETDIDSRLTSARQALAYGNNRAAAQLFTELSKEYPKDNRILMGRAVAFQRLGQNDQAITAYESVLSANPKNLEALTNMLGLIKIDNPGLAVEKLTQLRETYPDNADITAQLGLAHAGMGGYDDALRYLDIAEALNPGNPNILYNKAVLYDKMGRSLEAGELYRHVLRLESDDNSDHSFDTDAIKRRLTTLR